MNNARDAQRYSALDRINKVNAKDLKLAYAMALGGARRRRKRRLLFCCVSKLKT
jgi:glucose dehydrogenase